MELDDRMLNEIAGQLGIKRGKGFDRNAMNYLASKSDAELEGELLRVKEQLRAQNITYDKQLAMIKNIAPMMGPKERARLQRVVEILQR